MADDLDGLVQDASRGDGPAIDSLFQRSLPELRAFLRLRVGAAIRAQEATDDLVQTVCREVLQDLSAYRHHGEVSFKNWLYVTALRKIRDRARYYGREKRDRRREHAELDEEQLLSGYASLVTPSQVAIRREEVEHLESVFEQLPDEYRVIITEAKLIGLSHAEMADQRGKSIEATRALLYRALVRLGRLMTEG